MTIDTVQIRALRVAVTVADQGSFAAAGRRMNLPRAAISRIVGQLEDRAGQRLFRRNTRKVVTTEAGDILIGAARRALSELDAALEPDERTGALSGPVRLSVSHVFGRHFVLPTISSFRAHHPGVQVETLLQDKLEDMIDEDIDFTIRLGPMPQSELVVRRLGAIRAGLFAAPGFLRTLKPPLAPDTLGHVPAIGFRIPGTGHMMSWPIRQDGSVTRSLTPHSVVSSDSIEAVLDYAIDGQGVALLPHYLAAAAISAGRLEPVLPEDVTVLTDVHLCFRERRFMPRRVRRLIDHVAREITWKLTKQAH
ncbi:MAG: LysR family transcriptional regulator [Pseudomonadota bacterium]